MKKEINLNNLYIDNRDFDNNFYFYKKLMEEVPVYVRKGEKYESD